MPMPEKLREILQELHLQGMLECLDAELDRAEKQATPVADVLYRLALEERRVRQEKSLANRLKQARMPWDWTLESFPFTQQPGIDKTQINTLAGLDFVRRAQNLVFIGPPGTGKSGLACSLLRQACFNDYRCRFYDAQALLDELYASLADRSTPGLLKRLSNYDLLLIDEIGYLTLRPEQVNAFFKLMELRYARKATILTTNLDYPEWYELFKRKPLVDALLDRLRHHCITVRINGPSLRVPEQQPDPPAQSTRDTSAKPEPI
jgi:DNA replication protein DnaC